MTLYHCISWIGQRLRCGDIDRREHDRLFDAIVNDFARERREAV